MPMKYEEMVEFFAKNISYKKGWEFHIKEKNGVPYLQIQFVAPDNFTGKPERQYCRKWQLSEWMTKTELVRTAFLAVLQAERHETEETFKYKGADIFNSHLNVDALTVLVAANAYEHRGDAPKKPEPQGEPYPEPMIDPDLWAKANADWKAKHREEI
jgi:hypothetical protein